MYKTLIKSTVYILYPLYQNQVKLAPVVHLKQNNGSSIQKAKNFIHPLKKIEEKLYLVNLAPIILEKKHNDNSV